MRNISIATASTIILIMFLASCTKDSNVSPASSSTNLEERGTGKKYMNVLVYTRSSYHQHDAHDYSEGHILEFDTDWQSETVEYAAQMEDALAFMQKAVLSGDTTGQYQHLYTYVLPNSAYMDVYPDSALIFGPAENFDAFKTWIQNTCTTWMNQHGCTNVVISHSPKDAIKYYVKVHGGAN